MRTMPCTSDNESRAREAGFLEIAVILRKLTWVVRMLLQRTFLLQMKHISVPLRHMRASMARMLACTPSTTCLYGVEIHLVVQLDCTCTCPSLSLSLSFSLSFFLSRRSQNSHRSLFFSRLLVLLLFSFRSVHNALAGVSISDTKVSSVVVLPRRASSSVYSGINAILRSLHFESAARRTRSGGGSATTPSPSLDTTTREHS